MCEMCQAINEDGVCSRYGKKPPPGFSAKCKYYEKDAGKEAAIKAGVLSCSACGLSDSDGLGLWCCLLDQGNRDVVTYRRVYPDRHVCQLTGRKI